MAQMKRRDFIKWLGATTALGVAGFSRNQPSGEA